MQIPRVRVGPSGCSRPRTQPPIGAAGRIGSIPEAGRCDLLLKTAVASRMAAVMGYTCTSRRQSAHPPAAPQIPHALAHVARKPGSVKHFPVNRHDVGQGNRLFTLTSPLNFAVSVSDAVDEEQVLACRIQRSIDCQSREMARLLHCAKIWQSSRSLDRPSKHGTRRAPGPARLLSRHCGGRQSNVCVIVRAPR